LAIKSNGLPVINDLVAVGKSVINNIAAVIPGFLQPVGGLT
jgi:hypothetical protein